MEPRAIGCKRCNYTGYIRFKTVSRQWGEWPCPSCDGKPGHAALPRTDANGRAQMQPVALPSQPAEMAEKRIGHCEDASAKGEA